MARYPKDPATGINHNSKPVAELERVSLKYGRVTALDQVSLSIPANCIVGVIGPDGVGKSSLLGLIAGAKRLQSGHLSVLGGNFANSADRNTIQPRIAYMPQGLGRNLYPTLTVAENINFFGQLFGLSPSACHDRMDHLLLRTGLQPFAGRQASKLSGGMKQKLGICCALIHHPDLLILDEPTTGVDPLSRRQFWNLMSQVREANPELGILVSTAYMEEAKSFDWLIVMDKGHILKKGSPFAIQEMTNTDDLESAFIRLLPESQTIRYQPFESRSEIRTPMAEKTVAIEARELSCRFGDFLAVDHVSFRIHQGEIFGFIGSNGCGKTTTMKMLTGLLPASSGECQLFGQRIDAGDLQIRRRVGYMSQSFSLYMELTVRQNLAFHARLFHLSSDEAAQRIEELLDWFELGPYQAMHPDVLPLGIRQRLSLAVAIIHRPEVLILDEPTSGVDPMARDDFWRLMMDLSQRDGTTIFISTHFMNEAARCDRISLMHNGRVLATGTPDELIQQSGTDDLETAFMTFLEHSQPTVKESDAKNAVSLSEFKLQFIQDKRPASVFHFRRMFICMRRELVELARDPFRMALTFMGTLLLLIITSFGMSMEVKNLTFAVLDRDQSIASTSYLLALEGSPYFIAHAPVDSYQEIKNRMSTGELGMVLEIPHGFGRDLKRGNSPEIAVWIDGAMPNRAATIRSYLEGVHADYLRQLLISSSAVQPANSTPYDVQVRFRYNPDVDSLVSIIPAVIPLLLMMIPAMLAALGVVRERELGSIVNLYVTPLTRLEFLLGKQMAYVFVGMLNYCLMMVLVFTVFQIPVKGSMATLSLAALLYLCCSTALGLFLSAFIRTQIAAIFGVTISTMLPAVQFSGMLDPVSTLEGFGAVVGRIYPTSHFLSISRGVICKNLGLMDLIPHFLALAVIYPVLTGLSLQLITKQER